MHPVSTVRPKVAQLSFQLLKRTVHPELFQIYKTRRVEREHYTAKVDITSDGHVVSWNAEGVTLTEVASSAHQLLPANGRLLTVPLRNTGEDRLQVGPQHTYEYRYELQRVPAEMFLMIQKELGEASHDHDLMQVFNASGRIAIGGFSFVHVETRIHSLHIQAIHTFPDDLALVKSESVFRQHAPA